MAAVEQAWLTELVDIDWNKECYCKEYWQCHCTCRFPKHYLFICLEKNIWLCKYSQQTALTKAALIVAPNHIKTKIDVIFIDKVNSSVTQITVPQKLDMHVEQRTIGFPQCGALFRKKLLIGYPIIPESVIARKPRQKKLISKVSIKYCVNISFLRCKICL